MWQRNLLFVGLVGGGLLILVSQLIPAREPRPSTDWDRAAYSDASFRDVVDRVDRSFRQHWQANGIEPAGPATDLTIARRLSLGLMGTIPSLEEIRQFEWQAPEDRLPWWIDHLLQDRRFDDYFAERLARAFVGTEDGPFLLYRRRRFVTWLSEQLANKVPYDHIVRELITAQGIWTDRPAGNFLTVTSQQNKNNQPDPIRLAGRVTRAFLGLRLDCAECHNHPYAPWKQSDFQGLAAFFSQTHLGLIGLYDDDKGEFEAKDRRSEEKRVVPPQVPFAPELLPAEGTRRERLAAWVTDARNPYFARAAVNRVWALLLGRPLVDPVDNLETDADLPAALQILADDFAAHGFDLRRLIRVIASTEVFRLDSAADRDTSEEEEKAWAVFPLTRLRPEQVIGGLIQSSSLRTINSDSHIVTRLVKFFQTNDFVKRYGDSGEDDFSGRGGTIPQRLLLMNGELVRERIKSDPFNATARIGLLTRDNDLAVEVAYLAVLTRRPTPEEADHFRRCLDSKSENRNQQIEDLYWALINSTEFSWNH
jgi:hypothetical protein